MSRRDQEHDFLEIPNGWFAVAFSDDLKVGDVKPLHYFAQDMVLFRGRSGEAKVLDAFCPHLGAHLGHGGRVMGDTIRCPFHAWQYDGDSGECTNIPYCERIPAKARVRPWDVQEKNGMIWAWHHIEGKPPEWDFPVQPEIGHPDWSPPRTFDIEVPVHVQDMHENNNDPVHFQYVHKMMETPESEIQFAEDGRYYRIVSHSEQKTPLGTFQTSLIRDSWGIGLSAVSTAGIPNAGLLMYSSTTPIDERNTHSRWLLTATNNMVDIAGEEFMRNITQGVQDDMEIWTHKVHRARPVLCEADTYLVQFRKWTRQFYSTDHPADVA